MDEIIERYQPRAQVALRQICLYPEPENTLPEQTDTYTRFTRVRTILTFSSFALIFVFASLRHFVIHSATEDCKVVLLPPGHRFPIMRIQDRNDFGYHAVH